MHPIATHTGQPFLTLKLFVSASHIPLLGLQSEGHEFEPLPGLVKMGVCVGGCSKIMLSTSVLRKEVSSYLRSMSKYWLWCSGLMFGQLATCSVT